jgi:hypothetical protein
LKELSEKILHSDKSFMHIIYNNNKYIFPNDKTFLKDLIPKGKKRTAFSIKVDDKDSPRNNETIIIHDNNYKTPENTHHHASLDEALKSNLRLEKGRGYYSETPTYSKIISGLRNNIIRDTRIAILVDSINDFKIQIEILKKDVDEV